MQNLIAYRQRSYAKGMNDKLESSLIPDGFAEVAKNVVLRYNRIEKRTGYTMIANDLGSNKILGLAPYKTNNGTSRQVMCVNDSGSTSALYYWTGSGNWTAVTSGGSLTVDLDMNFEQANNRLYCFNGTDTVRRIDTTTASNIAAVPLGKFGKWFHNRMWVAGVTSNPNRVYFSNLNDPETWGANDYIDIELSDGDFVVGLNTMQDELIVFKSKQTWGISGFGAASFSATLKIPNYGAVSHRSVVRAGNELLFLSFDGTTPHVRSLKITSFGTLIYGGIVSDAIEGTMKALTNSQLSKACAIVSNNYMRLSVTNTGSSNNDKELIYDISNDGWTYNTGIAASCYAISDVSGTDIVYFGEATADSKVYKFDTATNDNGTAISMEYRTKKIEAGMPERKKRFKYLYVQAKSTGTYDINIDHTVDGYTFADTGTMSLSTTGSLWGTMVWGTGRWGLPDRQSQRLEMASDNTGTYIQVKFLQAVLDQPITIYSYELFYKTKGLREVSPS